MPHQPSLPPRDGRLGASSAPYGSQHDEPYYSNEDIEILHQIVCEGEAIYPNLPPRDRLPTNALFQAAELVLPLYGYDPEHAPPNISRLIFKIGGLRSGGSLMDKFASVLSNLGIQIEFVSSDLPDQSLSDRPASAQSSAGDPGQTGTFPISSHHNGRRRRNSDTTIPLPPPLEGGALEQPNRPRSHSFTSFTHPREDLPGVGPVDFAVPSSAEHALAGHPHARGGGDGSRRHPFHEEPLHSLVHGHLGPEDPEDPSASRADERSDDFLGLSDTTPQTSDDPVPGPVLDDRAYASLEKFAQALMRRSERGALSRVLALWEVAAYRSVREREHGEFLGGRIDFRLVLDEALLIWNDVASASWQDRVAAHGPFLDQARREKMERRADRAYSILLSHKAFTHWVACARDETDRTAVARRHILRKRWFGAWYTHHAENEAKVRRFKLQTTLRLWNRASIHQEARAEAAVGRYHYDVAKHVFEKWRDEFLSRLADQLRAYRSKEKCLVAWQLRSREPVALRSSCALYDERLLVEDVLETWQAGYEEVLGFEHDCTQRKLALDLTRVLDDWRTHVALIQSLRYFRDAVRWRGIQTALQTWRLAANTSRNRAQAAGKMTSHRVVTHWSTETRIRRFHAAVDRERKLEIVSQWTLAANLARHTRVLRQRTELRALAVLCSRFHKSSSKSSRGRRVADYLVAQCTQACAVESWWASSQLSAQSRKHAAAISFYSTADAAIRAWLARQEQAVAKTARHEQWAGWGVYYCTAVDTLSRWSRLAERTRRERLTNAYHALRRRHKAEFAARCVSTWRKAAGDALASVWYSEKFRDNVRKTDLGSRIRRWGTLTARMQVVCEVAEGAEMEVWWGRWSDLAARLRETGLDAAEYGSSQLLSRYWWKWEFLVLQCKGRWDTAATLQQMSDRNLCRQVLEVWDSGGAREGTAQELRLSTMSRRSLRLGSVHQDGWSQLPRTSLFNDSVNHPPRSPFPPLSRIPEADAPATGERTFGSTPRGYGQGQRQHREPSAAGHNGLSRSLPYRPGRQADHDDFRATAPQRLRAEGTAPPGTYGSQDMYGSLLEGASRYQQTPPAATRGLATPARPPSVSELDDDDDFSFSPGGGDDPAFMSTPSRRTGPLRRHDDLPTTTPSAILSTPHELALREEYGGLGGITAARRIAAGRGAARETARVTFADIREESAEYE